MTSSPLTLSARGIRKGIKFNIRAIKCVMQRTRCSAPKPNRADHRIGRTSTLRVHWTGRTAGKDRPLRRREFEDFVLEELRWRRPLRCNGGHVGYGCVCHPDRRCSGCLRGPSDLSVEPGSDHGGHQAGRFLRGSRCAGPGSACRLEGGSLIRTERQPSTPISSNGVQTAADLKLLTSIWSCSTSSKGIPATSRL